MREIGYCLVCVFSTKCAISLIFSHGIYIFLYKNKKVNVVYYEKKTYTHKVWVGCPERQELECGVVLIKIVIKYDFTTTSQ